MWKRSPSSWAWPAALGLACVLAQLIGPESLRFERGLTAHQPWRLLSAHLVHLAWSHLALNLVALALTWVLFGRRLPASSWTLAAMLCALAVGLGLELGTVTWYVGLSGVLHGLFVLGAAVGLRAEPAVSSLLLAGLAIKLVWEQLAGASPGMEHLVGGRIVVDAHLYGALAGIACLPVARRRSMDAG